MNIGEILSRAWQTIWRHKILWIFGILAGCGANGGNSGNFRYNMNDDQMPNQVERFFNQIDPTVLIIAGIVLVTIILVLVVISVFLSTIGRIGLIRGTAMVDQGATALSFGDVFNGSLPYFWRVFGLNLLVGLASFLVALVVVVMGIVATALTLGIGLVCLIPLICLMVPAFWLLSVVVEQANIAIVIENLSLMDGLRRGWEVFRANFGNILVMALILIIGISLIAGFIISAPLFAIAGPAILGIISNTNTGVQGGILVSVVLFLLYLPIMIVLNGILRSYIESAWTLTYLRLTGKPAEQSL